MLFQLENKYENASMMYSQILEELLPNGIENSQNLNHPELKATLLQMLSLSSPTETVNIYYLLNEISKEYSLPLAEVLETLGETDQALHFYEEYHKLNPRNLNVLSKLHALYLSLENEDLAGKVSEIIEQVEILQSNS